MADNALLVRARRVWEHLAGVPVAFPVRGVEVVASKESLLCPPGWAGIVVLGDAGIVTVPTDRLVDVVRNVLTGGPVEAATDVERLRAELPLTDVLGPATLAYLDARDFAPAVSSTVVEELSATHDDVVRLLETVSADDAGESGLTEITSSAFAVRAASEVVAVAGYCQWPGAAAHLSVLTAEEHRGRGLANIVGAAAVADALGKQLLPQWRARPAPSRRVARRLGFRELGAQVSVRLGAGRGPANGTAPGR